jgi:anti-anti-sigma factor
MRTETRSDVLFITGFTNLGATNAVLFKELAHAQFDQTHKNVEADFSEVRFIDSVGLGALLSVHKKACERGGRLVLVNPADNIRHFLELLHMDKVFHIAQL